ncbi:LOW QUALITY PROTEIN: tRNA-synt_1c_C domain-containing protein, partial [Cephalotus follicularis]
LEDSKDCYGLAPGKSIQRRYAFPIKYTVITSDNKKTLLEVRTKYDAFVGVLQISLKFIISQGVRHWVAEPSPGFDPLKVEVRLFDRLFLQRVYKVVKPAAFVVPSLQNAAVGDRFQFERLGKF